MSVQVREAHPSEYDEAGRVTAEAYREFVPAEGDTAWENYLATIAEIVGRADRTTILVAVDGDRVVGSATLELAGRTAADEPPLRAEEAHIRMLGVGPEARGRGVGRALMGACEDRALAAGKTVITLGTTRRMKAAQSMYRKLGFERGDDRVFDDGFVLLTFAKRLS